MAFGLPSVEEIKKIGEQVTGFVQWCKEALTVIIRNQQTLHRDMQQIKTRLGILESTENDGHVEHTNRSPAIEAGN